MLYQFVIQDSSGLSRTIAYGYVASEKYTVLQRMFEAFSLIHKETPVTMIQSILMDKMQAQIRAAEDVFGCPIILCHFHVLRAAKRKVSERTCNDRFKCKDKEAIKIFRSMIRWDDDIQ